MFVYSSLACRSTVKRAQAKLGPAANFRTFPDALKVIYQILVGRRQDLLQECSVQLLSAQERSRATHLRLWVRIRNTILLCDADILCELMINLLVGMILDNLGESKCLFRS